MSTLRPTANELRELWESIEQELEELKQSKAKFTDGSYALDWIAKADVIRVDADKWDAFYRRAPELPRADGASTAQREVLFGVRRTTMKSLQKEGIITNEAFKRTVGFLERHVAQRGLPYELPRHADIKERLVPANSSEYRGHDFFIIYTGRKTTPKRHVQDISDIVDSPLLIDQSSDEIISSISNFAKLCNNESARQIVEKLRARFVSVR